MKTKLIILSLFLTQSSFAAGWFCKQGIERTTNAKFHFLIVTKTENSSVEMNGTDYVEMKPINTQRTHTIGNQEHSYPELYPNLDYDIGVEQAAKFRESLGGGITKNQSEILTFAQYWNSRTVTYYPDHWYQRDYEGPYVYSAIVGDQIVLTLHRKMGEVVQVLTYPLVDGQRIEVPFNKVKKRLFKKIKMTGLFTIECKFQ